MAAKLKGKVLALDWDTRSLRVVYGSVTKRGVSIERALTARIPLEVRVDEPAELGAHIKRVLEAEHIHARHVLVDIPRDQAVLNTLLLPEISADELPGVVRIQIAKELPFPIEEAAVDFAAGSLEKGESDAVPNRMNVLVAAVRSEVLEKLKATCDAAGLRLDRVGLRPYAGKVAVEQLLTHAMPERVLYLDIRSTLTEINVIAGGSLGFSRAASVVIPEFPAEGQTLSISPIADDDDDLGAGVAGLADPGAESNVDSCVRMLFMEVMRTIEAYRLQEMGGTIDHVVIAGDLGVEEKLVEVIQDRLDVTAELYNPASTFGWDPDEGAEASSFAATLGLMLGCAREGILHFDFLHPKRVVTVTEKRLKKAPLIAAVIALFAVAGVASVVQLTKQDRATKKRLTAEIEELESHKRDNSKFMKFMDEVVAFDEQIVWVDVMDDIFRCMPSHEELVVEQVDMDQKRRLVKVRTICKQSDTALNTIDRLHMFRREGAELQRFEVTLGTRTEKPEDRYPYQQELKIKVLDDKADTPSKG